MVSYLWYLCNFFYFEEMKRIIKMEMIGFVEGQDYYKGHLLLLLRIIFSLFSILGIYRDCYLVQFFVKGRFVWDLFLHLVLLEDGYPLYVSPTIFQ